MSRAPSRRLNLLGNSPHETRSPRARSANSHTPLIKGNIRCYARIKPTATTTPLITCTDQAIQYDGNTYCFDRVIAPNISQAEVYDRCARQVIQGFMQGRNGTIFAFGQTGSGKTYTMFGDDGQAKKQRNGIVQTAIREIFGKHDGRSILRFSMLEIYKEQLIDLVLNPSETPAAKIRIGEEGGSIKISGLLKLKVESCDDVFKLIQLGRQHRKIRETSMNAKSSRSHVIVTLYAGEDDSALASCPTLHLIDLAGSEKISKSKVEGVGVDEAIKINLSLSCLANTILALSKNQDHIPFRQSKLTRILQDSLSGNSLTSIVVTCSLHQSCIEETLMSLKFGSRSRRIKITPTVNSFRHSVAAIGHCRRCSPMTNKLDTVSRLYPYNAVEKLKSAVHQLMNTLENKESVNVSSLHSNLSKISGILEESSISVFDLTGQHKPPSSKSTLSDNSVESVLKFPLTCLENLSKSKSHSSEKGTPILTLKNDYDKGSRLDIPRQPTELMRRRHQNDNATNFNSSTDQQKQTPKPNTIKLRLPVNKLKTPSTNKSNSSNNVNDSSLQQLISKVDQMMREQRRLQIKLVDLKREPSPFFIQGDQSLQNDYSQARTGYISLLQNTVGELSSRLQDGNSHRESHSEPISHYIVPRQLIDTIATVQQTNTYPLTYQSALKELKKKSDLLNAVTEQSKPQSRSRFQTSQLNEFMLPPHIFPLSSKNRE